MAENQSGRIAAHKTRIQWLAGTEDLRPHESEPGRWLRDVAALGHMEVDWAKGTWHAAPLVLTRVPAGDGLALLCGLRTGATDKLLDEAELVRHTVEQAYAADHFPRPSAAYVQYDPGESLASLAAAIRATYVPCAAEQIAGRLPLMAPGAAAAPPARNNDTLRYYNGYGWSPVEGEPRLTGAYQYTALGRPEFRWFENDEWRRIDLSTGVFLSLKRAGRSALRWRAEGSGGRTGQLFVDWGAALPPLQQRALVLCTGLTPRFPDRAQTGIYDNVPRALAQRVAASLHQRLEDA